jgi:hypothetical protein
VKREAPEGARTVRTEWAEWDLTNEAWKTPSRETVEEYRPDGKLLVSEFSFAGGGSDEAGRVIRQLCRAPDGTERVAEEYAYAADGTSTRVFHLPIIEGATNIQYGVDGTDFSVSAPGATTMTTAYDSEGRASEVLMKSAEGAILRRVVLTRDESGRLVKDELFLGGEPMHPDILMFGAGASLMTSEYTYDERGLRVEVVRRMFGLCENRETFRYDDRGNMAESTTEERQRSAELRDGNIEAGEATVDRRQARMDYTFDERGNWTERVTSQRQGENPDFTPCSIERREIVYY